MAMTRAFGNAPYVALLKVPNKRCFPILKTPIWTTKKKLTIIVEHPVFLGMIYRAQDMRNLKQQRINLSQELFII